MDLGGNARIIFARHFAAVHGYARTDEALNRQKSDSALSSLGNLIEVLKRNGAPFTVADFDKLAARYHAEVKGGKPWYTPCAVKPLLVVKARP